MKTAFLGEAYRSRSPILGSQTAINVYLELIATETPGSGTGGYYGTPGRLAVFTGSGAVRGLWVAGTGVPGQFYLFAVIGLTLYRLDQYYNATALGTIPGVGAVSLIDNGAQLGVFHSAGAHWVALTGSAVAPISGAPAGGTASALDNYVLFSENQGGEFGITALGDLSSIDPLDVATAEGWPDDCVGVLADHRLAWLLGTETIEIWSDTGNALFPFERVPGGFMEQGCAAFYSAAKVDNSVFWLGRDKKGGGVVYRENGYVPIRISTHAVEYAINQGVFTDAIGYSYQEEGHLFYQLTLPSTDQTWVYDVATGPNGAWHQRASQDGQGVLHRDRANCHAYFYGDHIVGDYANGILYRQSLGYTTDNGSAVYRERAWEIDEDETENQRIRIDELKVRALAGDGQSAQIGGAPLLSLQVSRDGGQTFGYQRFQKLGKLGQRKAQARWRRLGSGRNTVLKLATNMTERVSWTGAYMKGEVLGV